MDNIFHDEEDAYDAAIQKIEDYFSENPSGCADFLLSLLAWNIDVV